VTRIGSLRIGRIGMSGYVKVIERTFERNSPFGWGHARGGFNDRTPKKRQPLNAAAFSYLGG